MNNKVKYGIFGVLALIGLAIIFIYTPERDVASEIAFANLESKTLIDEFGKDSKKSTEKFLNQTLIIKGKITENSGNLIVLDDIISCSLLSVDPTVKLKLGDQIVVKGKLTGYENDILTEIKMQECTIIKE